MKQKCYKFYCEHLKKKVGDGTLCFICPHYTRSQTADKKCEHERVIKTYEREV